MLQIIITRSIISKKIPLINIFFIKKYIYLINIMGQSVSSYLKNMQESERSTLISNDSCKDVLLSDTEYAMAIVGILFPIAIFTVILLYAILNNLLYSRIEY
jgi:hypothetical protein